MSSTETICGICGSKVRRFAGGRYGWNHLTSPTRPHAVVLSYYDPSTEEILAYPGEPFVRIGRRTVRGRPAVSR